MKSKSKPVHPKRGDIWLVDFNPKVGSEVAKRRPAIVVGVNSIGKLPLRIVVPITDWKDRYDAFVWFTKLAPTPGNGLSKMSGADGFQVKSVSLDRFHCRLGRVTASKLTDIVNAIALCIGV
ncbi:MAG: type II toxin-antitoxin system PemK/MazF family toxin [Lentisphaeria bacterium]|nr:type II toxin-antitoxin system PemK/MazF family toxin [Lentisphaeria bacterium]